MTAHELPQENPDIVITTYEQVESSFRPIRDLQSDIDSYIADAGFGYCVCDHRAIGGGVAAVFTWD